MPPDFKFWVGLFNALLFSALVYATLAVVLR